MMAADPLRNPAKDSLARGELVASITVRMVRTAEIARIARTAGFDMLYIDLEHSPLSIDATSQICLACLDLGLTAAVRVPANTPEYIGRVLDTGALGVIAPHVRSAAEAREVVKAEKFPPQGERGNAAPLPHVVYRTLPAGELARMVNEATMVIVQLESADAVERVDEIVAVEGVDVALVGLNDYLADIGLPGQYDHPRVRDCYSRVIEACRRHGKHDGVGGLASRPGLIAEYVRMGARHVSSGTDIAFLLGAAAARAKQIRNFATRPLLRGPDPAWSRPAPSRRIPLHARHLPHTEIPTPARRSIAGCPIPESGGHAIESRATRGRRNPLSNAHLP